MSVFSFWGQDSVAKTKVARFCQIKSRQSREGGWDFEARVVALRRCKIWAGKEWLKGVNGRSGQDMEAWTGIQRFGRFDKDRLARRGVQPFQAGWTGQKHLGVLFSRF